MTIKNIDGSPYSDAETVVVDKNQSISHFYRVYIDSNLCMNPVRITDDIVLLNILPIRGASFTRYKIQACLNEVNRIVVVNSSGTLNKVILMLRELEHPAF